MDDIGDIVDTKEISSALTGTNIDINERFGTCGIDLVPVNIRVEENVEQITLLVTDLCSQIERLKELPSRI